MTSLVAGIDSSTQATKVVVVEATTGAVVAQGRAPHVVRGKGGARETDPETWWGGLRAAIADTGIGDRIAALSVAAQQHGLVVLGHDLRPLRPAVLWNDTRSAPCAEQLVARLGGPAAWAEAVGSVPVAAFTIASWAWLRQVEPETVARTTAIRLPHDYLTERLTGRAVTDRGDASGTGWWSPGSERYNEQVLSLPEVEIDPAVLPEVVPPGEAAGELLSSAASYLGLPAGIPIGPGTGDNMAAALGLGLAEGVPVLSLGTSGTVYAVSDRPTADPSGVVAGFGDATGKFLPLSCTLNCALAIDRMADLLGCDRDAVAADTDVVVLPFLDGERTPDLPRAAGTVLGLRHSTQPGEILLAAYRGAVVSLLGALDRISQAGCEIAPKAPLILIGGGARGATWRSVVAELSGRALDIPDEDELVARGAAVQAASVLLGREPSEVAQEWGSLPGVKVPAGGGRPEIRERYLDLLESMPLLYP